MNKILAMTVLGCFLATSGLISGLSIAQEKPDEHAGHHPADGAAAPATTTQKAEAPQQRMQDNMKKMHELMEKIHAAKSPEKKQRLLEQHHGAMHEQMKMMNGMKGDGKMPMMGGKGGPGAKGGMGEKGGMMDGEMMKHHQAMMHRMDMMQDMMGQMMEHMSVEHHMMKPDPAKKK